MNALAERQEVMQSMDELAREYEGEGQESLREFAAMCWHELATEDERKTAPSHLRYSGNIEQSKE